MIPFVARSIPPRPLVFLLCVLVTVACPACLQTLPEQNPMKYAPPSAGEPWKPDASQVLPPLPSEKLSDIPPELKATADNLTLTELVDVALRNGPVTQLAWERARVAAASWAETRGEYYPAISGNVGGTGGKISQAPEMDPFRGVYGEVGVSLDYLLLDFGGRKAKVESARQALIAANWNHDQAIQDVLRNVSQAFYTYLGNKARVRSTEVSLQEARTSLRSTSARRRAGVSTIADVLQARAKMEQVRFDLVAHRGDVEISRGELAMAVGWPANTVFDVAEPPDKLPLDRIKQNTDNLVEIAQRDRPELIAARASVYQKEAELRKSESALWPQLVATGNAGWIGANGRIDTGDIDGNDTKYYGGLQLQIPFFEGFSLRNAVRRTKADLDAARAELRLKQESIIADAWTAYYDFRTAVQQLEASESLLASSNESYRVSLARYRAGAADIVELLNAQSTLALARAQRVEARTSVHTSYAEFVHAIGAQVL